MQRRWICRRIRSYLASASFQRNWSSSQVQTTGSIFCAGNAFGDRHASARKVLCTLAWHLSTRENRHREFLVVSQGRVARAKVAAALAARASDLASRGDETCPMRTILFVSGSCCVVAFLDDCGLTAA